MTRLPRIASLVALGASLALPAVAHTVKVKPPFFAARPVHMAFA